MKRTENVELTVLCLIRRGNEYLLQDRIKKDWRGFTLPGGHVEPGESLVDSVVREMQEETGLTIRHPKLIGSKSWMQKNGSRKLRGYTPFLLRIFQNLLYLIHLI